MLFDTMCTPHQNGRLYWMIGQFMATTLIWLVRNGESNDLRPRSLPLGALWPHLRKCLWNGCSAGAWHLHPSFGGFTPRIYKWISYPKIQQWVCWLQPSSRTFNLSHYPNPIIRSILLARTIILKSQFVRGSSYFTEQVLCGVLRVYIIKKTLTLGLSEIFVPRIR